MCICVVMKSIRKNVTIREEQEEWLNKQPRTFNLSELMQKALDKEMKKGMIVQR